MVSPGAPLKGKEARYERGNHPTLPWFSFGEGQPASATGKESREGPLCAGQKSLESPGDGNWSCGSDSSTSKIPVWVLF